MTLRELSQLYHLRREVYKEKKRLVELRARAENMGVQLSGMPHSIDVSDKVGEMATLLAYQERVIQEKITRCEIERILLEEYIAAVPDSLTRRIMTERFVNGKTWRKVADSVGGTEDSAKKTCYRYINSH